MLYEIFTGRWCSTMNDKINIAQHIIIIANYIAFYQTYIFQFILRENSYSLLQISNWSNYFNLTI